MYLQESASVISLFWFAEPRDFAKSSVNDFPKHLFLWLFWFCKYLKKVSCSFQMPVTSSKASVDLLCLCLCVYAIYSRNKTLLEFLNTLPLYWRTAAHFYFQTQTLSGKTGWEEECPGAVHPLLKCFLS